MRIEKGPAARLRFTAPAVKMESGRRLSKENWIVQDARDPDHFKHFLAYIHRPGQLDPDLPALLLMPGMLCNGNLFRLVPHEGNFRNLDTGDSFANVLASMGFRVVLANPRYCRWIYGRYVNDKLGVKNYFSDAVDFERLAGDLSFYLDAALHLTQAKSAAVLGFSMGGMLLMNHLANVKSDERISHAVFMGAPIEFSNRQAIILLLNIYNFLAKFVPVRRYAALELLARNLVPAKHLLKKLPPEVFVRIPLGRALFNPKQVDPQEIIPFISYVLEPMPSPIIEFLIRTVARGEFPNIAAELGDCDIPSLVVCGDRDGLVSEASNRRLFESLGGARKKLEIVHGAGHLDLVAGLGLQKTARTVADFVRLPGKFKNG